MVTRTIKYSQRSALHRFPTNQNRTGVFHMEERTRDRMDLHPQPDWQRAVGQYAEIRRYGKTIRTGIVEAVMPDNSILWISAAGAYLREMIQRGDGVEVYLRYPWDPPPSLDLLHPGSNTQATANS